MWCGASNLYQAFLHYALMVTNSSHMLITISSKISVTWEYAAHLDIVTWKYQHVTWYCFGVNIQMKFRRLPSALIYSTTTLLSECHIVFSLQWQSTITFTCFSNSWQKCWFPSLTASHPCSLSQRCGLCPRDTELLPPGCYSSSTGILQLTLIFVGVF